MWLTQFRHWLQYKHHFIFFSQVCWLWDWVLSTTRNGHFDPKSAGFPCACGPHPGGTVDIEDLPHRWGNASAQPERAAGNTVSKTWTEIHRAFTETFQELKNQDAQFSLTVFPWVKMNWNTSMLTCIVNHDKSSARKLLPFLALSNRDSETDSESESSTLGSNA